MEWPSSSPELTPIEHVMEAFKDRVKKRPSRNKEELALYLVQECNKIELSVLKKFVDSVPSRLNTCLEMKGYATRY